MTSDLIKALRARVDDYYDEGVSIENIRLLEKLIAVVEAVESERHDHDDVCGCSEAVRLDRIDKEMAELRLAVMGEGK